jgi:hypothetical protein
LVDLDRFLLDPHVLALLPSTLAHQHRAVPLLAREDLLVVAFATPDDVSLQAVAEGTGRRVEPVIADAEQIRRVLAQYYP